jgi:tetratricopeptide (TPR) repeat protein
MDAFYYSYVADFFFTKKKNYAEADTLFRKAFAIVKEQPPDDRYAEFPEQLAEFYHAQGKYAEAELLYKQVLGVTQARATSEGPWEAQDKFESRIVLQNLADLYRAQNRNAEAEEYNKRAQEVWGALIRANVDGFHHIISLARQDYEQGRKADARSLSKEVIGVSVRELARLPPASENYFSIIFDYEKFLEDFASFYSAVGESEMEEMFYKELLSLKLPSVSAFYSRLYESKGKAERRVYKNTLGKYAFRLDKYSDLLRRLGSQSDAEKFKEEAGRVRRMTETLEP